MKVKIKVEKKSKQVGTGEFSQNMVERITKETYYLIHLKYEDGTELSFEWDIDFGKPLGQAEMVMRTRKLYQEYQWSKGIQKTKKEHIKQVEQLDGQEIELVVKEAKK